MFKILLGLPWQSIGENPWSEIRFHMPLCMVKNKIKNKLPLRSLGPVPQMFGVPPKQLVNPLVKKTPMSLASFSHLLAMGEPQAMSCANL